MNSKIKNKWRFSYEILMIVLGTIVMGVSFSIFMEPQNISTGGFSGIAMIIKELASKVGADFLSSGLIYLILNFGLFIYAFRALGKRFAIKAFIGIFSYSIFMQLFKLFKFDLNLEPLVASIYGGALMGVGLGLVVRYGGSTGGGDMIACIVRKSHPKFTVGSIVLCVDVAVVLASIFVFENGLEILPYTLIALGLALVLTDMVNDGYKQIKAFYIITDKPDKICQKVLDGLQRSCTISKVTGVHSHGEKTMILCLVSKYQTIYLKKIVRYVDREAFLFAVNVSEIMGNWIAEPKVSADNEVEEFSKSSRKNKEEKSISLEANEAKIEEANEIIFKSE